MNHEMIDKEVYLLLSLPNYLQRKRNELDSVHEYIAYPIQRPHETGILVSDSLPVDIQAFKLIKRRERIERQMQQAIKHSSVFVQAINSLFEADKTRFIDYYTKGKKNEIGDVLERITGYYEVQH